MFLEAWGILYYGFLARLPLIWREQETFLPSNPGLNSAEGCTQSWGARGQVVPLSKPGMLWRSCTDGCQARGQGWSELRPPLPGADCGVTRTMQSFGNAGVPNNCQEMSIPTVVTSSTLDTVLARSCGELAPT